VAFAVVELWFAREEERKCKAEWPVVAVVGISLKRNLLWKISKR